MQHVEYIDLINNLRIERRILRDRLNPLEYYNDEEFRVRFRFSKDTLINLILPDILPELQRPTRRSFSLTPIQQICAVLRFYSCGSYQRVVGDTIQIHRTTISKLVRQVSITIIARLKHRYISIPNERQKVEISRGFQERCRFPGVIGAIDCTHIKIAYPHIVNPGMYMNRKNFYSINCQMICDHENKFWNIVARWPGSTHDSRIFDNSSIGNKLANREQRGILLGDPGYPCLPNLLTPIAHPANQSQRRYNSCQRNARGTVERAFGILKRRFGVLGPDARLRCSVDTDMAVITSCTILHNIAVTANENHNFPEPEPIELGNFNQFREFEGHNGAASVRRTVIEEYF